jgi:hypothetical protein
MSQKKSRLIDVLGDSNEDDGDSRDGDDIRDKEITLANDRQNANNNTDIAKIAGAVAGAVIGELQRTGGVPGVSGSTRVERDTSRRGRQASVPLRDDMNLAPQGRGKESDEESDRDSESESEEERAQPEKRPGKEVKSARTQGRGEYLFIPPNALHPKHNLDNEQLEGVIRRDAYDENFLKFGETEVLDTVDKIKEKVINCNVMFQELGNRIPRREREKARQITQQISSIGAVGAKGAVTAAGAKQVESSKEKGSLNTRGLRESIPIAPITRESAPTSTSGLRLRGQSTSATIQPATITTTRTTTRTQQRPGQPEPGIPGQPGQPGQPEPGIPGQPGQPGQPEISRLSGISRPVLSDTLTRSMQSISGQQLREQGQQTQQQQQEKEHRLLQERLQEQERREKERQEALQRDLQEKERQEKQKQDEEARLRDLPRTFASLVPPQAQAPVSTPSIQSPEQAREQAPGQASVSPRIATEETFDIATDPRTSFDPNEETIQQSATLRTGLHKKNQDKIIETIQRQEMENLKTFLCDETDARQRQKIFENTGQIYKNLLDNWNSQWTQKQLGLVEDQMNNFYDEFANFNGIYSLFLFCSILDGFIIGSFTDNCIFCDLVTLGKKKAKDTIEKVKTLYTLRLNFMKKFFLEKDQVTAQFQSFAEDQEYRIDLLKEKDTVRNLKPIPTLWHICEETMNRPIWNAPGKFTDYLQFLKSTHTLYLKNEFDFGEQMFEFLKTGDLNKLTDGYLKYAVENKQFDGDILSP